MAFFWRKKRREVLEKMLSVESGQNMPKRVYSTIRKKYLSLRNRRRRLITLLEIVALLNVVMAVWYYNRLNTLSQKARMARADIETCLQMRENLIPVLINTVSDFVKHEDDIFMHAADARAISLGAKKSVLEGARLKEPQQEGTWSDLLSRIFAVAERYPDLKVAGSFQTLLTKVSEAETAILEKRIAYNGAAQELNTLITSFPIRLYALPFGFRPVRYFEWKEEPEWVSTLRSRN